MQVFLGMCGTSLTYAVIYRTASLYDKQYILRKKSVIFILIFVEVLYTSPAVISGTLILPSHIKSVEYMSQVRNYRFTCLASYQADFGEIDEFS